MNLSYIKKFMVPFAALALFNACDKADTTPQLGTSGQNIIRVNTYGGVADNFKQSAIVADVTSTDPITVEFQLEYVGPKVFDRDLTITVGVNDAARVAYNATVDVLDRYEAMPANFFTLNTTTATIKAGEVFSTPLSVTIPDPSLLDPAVSYMFPISITGVANGSDGVTGAPSTGTAYFHIIGNPLAGPYHSTGYFYHPALPRDIDEDKMLLPNSPDELFVDLGDLGGAGYVALFKTNPTTNKVSIKIAPGAAGGTYFQFDSGLPGANRGYTPQWPNSAGCTNVYDPATKTFKVRYGYLGATGYRVTEEYITKM